MSEPSAEVWVPDLAAGVPGSESDLVDPGLHPSTPVTQGAKWAPARAVQRELASTAAGVAAASGLLSSVVSLGGASVGSSSASGDLGLLGELSSTVSGVATVTADLSTSINYIELSSTVAGHGRVVGNLRREEGKTPTSGKTWKSIDLSRTILYYGTVYNGDGIAPPPGGDYANFSLPMRMESGKFYELEFVMRENQEGAGTGVDAYSMLSSGDPDASYWYYLGGSGTSSEPERTVSLTIGPGIKDYDDAVAAGEDRVLIGGYRTVFTSVRWRVSDWSTPIRLSSHIPYDDADSISEGASCVLDSGLVVVAGVNWISDMWMYAIDPSGDSGPVVGPPSNQNLPGGPGYDRDIIDLSDLVPLGDYAFAMVGASNRAYGPLGDESYHMASFYKVDPVTLKISLHSKALVPARDSSGVFTYFVDESTSARWRDSVLVLSYQYTATGIVLSQVDYPSGIHTPHKISDPIDNNRPGPLAVVGDYAFFTVGDSVHRFIRLHLPTDAWDSILASAVPDVDPSFQWNQFMAPLNDGERVALIYRSNPAGSYSELSLMIINVMTLSVEHRSVVVPTAQAYGWTGGWYSDVRSVQVAEDGTIVIGFSDRSAGPLVKYATVDPSTYEVTGIYTSNLGGFSSAGSYTFYFTKALPIANGGVGLTVIGRRPDTQVGLWYTQSMPSATLGVLKVKIADAEGGRGVWVPATGPWKDPHDW